MKKALPYLGVFSATVLFFSLFQPWGSFRDPDAFYHAKMASLLLERGILNQFPWLDLTTLGANFANQHFLFHVLDAPFVFFFGMLQGHQVASVIFGASFITAFFFVLRSLKIEKPYHWTALLLILPPVIARLNLGKASPIALTFFFLGLLFVAKRAWKPLFFIMTLYVLAHGGWPLLILMAGVYLFGELIYEKYVLDKTWRKVTSFFDRTTLLTIGSLFSGALAGVLIHPNRGALLEFLKTQIISIGVTTPFDRVLLGIEWRPYELPAFIFDFSFLWIMALVLIFGFLFARRRQVKPETMKWGVALGLCAAVFFALTLKSRRFGEYMGPMFVLWFAVLAQTIDWNAVRQEFLRTETSIKALIIVLLIAAFGRGMWATYDFFHMNTRGFDRLVPALEVADQYLEPGDRLYHSNWALFPELFANRDAYTYIAGLDPVFLLEANPELSDAYTSLMVNGEGADAYEIIHNKFDSSIALFETRTDTDLIQSLKTDSRFELLFEDEAATLFLVR